VPTHHAAIYKYSDKGDILTEIRFYVPNSELDSIKEDKKP
jgi:hypothetical protein